MCDKNHKGFMMAALAIVLLLLSASANATDDVKFCIRYETHFDDGDLGDYYNQGSPVMYDSIRPHVRVYDNDTQQIVSEQYAADGNCTQTLYLNESHDYKVTVIAAALMTNDNEIRAYDEYSDPDQHSQVLVSSYNPPGDETKTLTYQFNETYMVSNIMAAAGWAVNRRSAGLSDQNFDYFTEPCPGGTNSCWKYDGGDTRIYLSATGRSNKYITIHEAGHEILYRKNGNNATDFDCSYRLSDGACGNGEYGNSHCDHCKEWQSCAANEGWADFYSIAAWNNENGADCDPHFDDYIDSCESDGAYMESNCCALGCAGKACESDWAHFWWDLYGNEGYSVADIAQVLNISNPEDWVDGSDDDLYNTIKSAGLTFGITTYEWNQWASWNGIDH